MKRNLLRIKCATAMSLFLAHRYATVVIILLVEMGSDHRPVWCNTPPPPRPLCNQAQTRWLKALLQLPVWKALFDPHQRQYSHGLQTPLGSADTTSKQSGQLFLPHAKKPLMFCSCSLTSVEYCPSLSAVSGFQDSQVMRIWHSWNCWIQHVRLCLFPQKKEINKNNNRSN